ncbi:hypothetical protein P12x_004111 [Tundrisphaera lichenicola]|uniref:hypothetical protein n=1 Tax=Tundrisphaera lichenicola TaxID=2029860 RepID=UPI003EBB2BA1
MRRNLWVGLIVGGILGLVANGVILTPLVRAQKVRTEPAWEYKVAVFSYNPGERMTEEQRAAFYERTLNEQARLGWEAVGTVLSRDVVQTVGGGVTTRDTSSFVAYRRLKR